MNRQYFLHAAGLASCFACLLFSFPAKSADITIETSDSNELELADKPMPSMTVKAKLYTVEIFSNGRVRMFSGKTEILSNLAFGLDRKEALLADIRKTGENRVLMIEGEIKKSALDSDLGDNKGGPELVTAQTTGKTADLPGIELTFLADRIEIAPKNLRPQKTPEGGLASSYVLAGVFGDNALAVKNLLTGVEDALPAEHIAGRHMFSFEQGYGQYWPDINVTYADGTRLDIRSISGIAHYRISGTDPYTNESMKSKRGYWANRDVKPETKVVLAIQPADSASAISPAPYFTVDGTQPLNMFFPDEPVRFNLNFAAGYVQPGDYTVSWRMEDHCQRPAGEGKQEIKLADGAASVPIDLKPKDMGFFRAHLSMAKVGTPKSAVRSYDFNFARIRPEFPKYRDMITEEGMDMEAVLGNLIGMRGIRSTPSPYGIWNSYRTADGKDIDWDKYDKSLASYIKVARGGSIKDIVFLISGSPEERVFNKWIETEYKDKDKSEREEIRETMMARLYTGWAKVAAKNGVHVWEPWNEPNLCMGPESYIDNVLKKIYPAIKAGDPKANFLGGSICGLENQAWVRRLYELGGNKYFDGTSFHPYTGAGFDDIYRSELDQWWQILRDFKDNKNDLWMTESAWHRGWGFQDYLYDKYQARRESQARNAVVMHLNAEAMNISRNKIYVFYLIEHGYNEFFLFYYKYPTSSAISIQVMNECLRDAAFEQELPLPGQGHHFLVFKDAKRRVATIYTGSDTAELDIATDAASVTLTDLMGNRSELKPDNGRIRVPVSGDPVYLTVDVKNTLRPAYDKLQVQPNLALVTLGATATSSSFCEKYKELAAKFAGLGVNGAISGDWTNYSGLRVFGQDWGWAEDETAKDKFPDWYEVKLPKPAPVSRVLVVHEYGGWARTLRDYDVQVFTGNDWKTVAEMRGNFYSYATVHEFAPVTTDRVRIFITGVNCCLFGTSPWLPRISSIRALEIYGPSAGPAKVFFVQDVPRRRVLKPGESIEWKVSLRNATNAKVAGNLKLTLPQGVTMSPSEIPVTIEPDATAVASIKFQFAPDAKEGFYTAVAGLYDGDSLISSDLGTCVLSCKRPVEPPKPQPQAAEPEKKADNPKDKTGKDKDKKKEVKDEIDNILDP